MKKRLRTNEAPGDTLIPVDPIIIVGIYYSIQLYFNVWINYNLIKFQ